MDNPRIYSQNATGNKVEKERLNLYLPKPLVDELRALVPARERTQFIVDVLARELRRSKLLKAIENSFGAWKDEDHSNMATGKDIDAWIQRQRL
jgi:hypothetical protein